MKEKRLTLFDSDDLSTMSREELKNLLAKEDSRAPKYLFSVVERVADTREYRYVFWLDLMGARSLMKLSLPRAARSVMKIHAAALLARETFPDLDVNPVMDGVYGFVSDRKTLQNCLRQILQSL